MFKGVKLQGCKLVLADARKKMKYKSKDKNTIQVVKKAKELFNNNPKKYLK